MTRADGIGELKRVEVLGRPSEGRSAAKDGAVEWPMLSNGEGGPIAREREASHGTTVEMVGGVG